jgi:transposase-like protein
MTIETLSKVNGCPRCKNGFVKQDYESEEPTCLNCGWALADFIPPKRIRDTDSLMSGVHMRLRYTGQGGPRLRETVLKVKARRVHASESPASSTTALDIICPFCNALVVMEAAHVSGNRKHKDKKRYRCVDSHFIWLVEENGTMSSWE